MWSNYSENQSPSTCKYFRRIFVIYYIISIRQLEYYYQIIFFKTKITYLGCYKLLCICEILKKKIYHICFCLPNIFCLPSRLWSAPRPMLQFSTDILKRMFLKIKSLFSGKNCQFIILHYNITHFLCPVNIFSNQSYILRHFQIHSTNYSRYFKEISI